MTPTSTPGSAGVGQMDPSDTDSDFNMTCFIVRQIMSTMDTMKLVQVIKVTGGGGAIAAAGTVDVQLLVNSLDGAGNATKEGVVYGIPWWRLSGGRNAVICDPIVGDIGYVAVSDRDISNVKTAAAAGKSPQVNPGSYRQYSIADGVYVGSVLTKDAPQQYLAFTATGIKIVDLNGNVIEFSASGIAITPTSGMPVTVNGSLVVTQNLQLGGALQSVTAGVYGGLIHTAGDVQAGSISLTTHTHSQGNDSHGDTEANTSAPL